MRHGLLTMFPAVEYQPIAIDEILLFGYLPGYEEQMAHQWGMFGLKMGNGRDGFAWDDKDMRGGYRVNVAKGKTLLIFINEYTGYFPICNALKKGFFRHRAPDICNQGLECGKIIRTALEMQKIPGIKGNLELNEMLCVENQAVAICRQR